MQTFSELTLSEQTKFLTDLMLKKFTDIKLFYNLNKHILDDVEHPIFAEWINFICEKTISDRDFQWFFIQSSQKNDISAFLIKPEHKMLGMMYTPEVSVSLWYSILEKKHTYSEKTLKRLSALIKNIYEVDKASCLLRDLYKQESASLTM